MNQAIATVEESVSSNRTFAKLEKMALSAQQKAEEARRVSQQTSARAEEQGQLATKAADDATRASRDAQAAAQSELHAFRRRLRRMPKGPRKEQLRVRNE